MAAENIGLLARQYLTNNDGFRRYVHEQAFLALPPLLIRAAKELIPTSSLPTLNSAKKWEYDLKCLTERPNDWKTTFFVFPGPNSTHVLNAISPAFTASFALADLIIDRGSYLNLI